MSSVLLPCCLVNNNSGSTFSFPDNIFHLSLASPLSLLRGSEKNPYLCSENNTTIIVALP